MSFSIIAAIGKNYELGKNGKLCFNLPGDLKYFKQTTKGHTILMGSKTFKSLPGLLPGRKHLVLSHQDATNFPPDVSVYHSISDLLLDYPAEQSEEIFVIGGGKVYQDFLNLAQKIYLTRVNAAAPGADTFFPEFDESKFDVAQVGSGEDHGISYNFVVYTKKEEL
jgi:dihydrofolate reductase